MRANCDGHRYLYDLADVAKLCLTRIQRWKVSSVWQIPEPHRQPFAYGVPQCQPPLCKRGQHLPHPLS